MKYIIKGKETELIQGNVYGFSKRELIGRIADNHVAIIKNRKSRIIMKDGKALLLKVQNIYKTQPDTKVSIATNAPVCSKTTKFLAEKNIEILPLKVQ